METAINRRSEREWKDRVAQRIRFVRGRASQQEFAYQIQCSQQALSKWEHGKVPENWRVLARLAEQGVDLNALLASGGNGR